jgi:hypothetical protein
MTDDNKLTVDEMCNYFDDVVFHFPNSLYFKGYFRKLSSEERIELFNKLLTKHKREDILKLYAKMKLYAP